MVYTIDCLTECLGKIAWYYCCLEKYQNDNIFVLKACYDCYLKKTYFHRVIERSLHCLESFGVYCETCLSSNALSKEETSLWLFKNLKYFAFMFMRGLRTHRGFVDQALVLIEEMMLRI